jgi:hypothetical protein
MENELKHLTVLQNSDARSKRDFAQRTIDPGHRKENAKKSVKRSYLLRHLYTKRARWCINRNYILTI